MLGERDPAARQKDKQGSACTASLHLDPLLLSHTKDVSPFILPKNRASCRIANVGAMSEQTNRSHGTQLNPALCHLTCCAIVQQY